MFSSRDVYDCADPPCKRSRVKGTVGGLSAGADLVTGANKPTAEAMQRGAELGKVMRNNRYERATRPVKVKAKRKE